MPKIHWAHSADGSFNVASNWSPAQIPGSGDEADLDVGGAYTVTLDANAAVQALIVADVGAKFAIGAGLTFTLGSGTSANLGTINLAASNTGTHLVAGAGGTLVNGATGTINLNDVCNLEVDGTLKNFGTININGHGSLGFVGDPQLTGGGRVNLNGGFGFLGGSTLTNVDNTIVGAGKLRVSTTLVNDSVIGATTPQANLFVQQTASNGVLINNGTMFAALGTMQLQMPVTNNQAIAAVQQGTIELQRITVSNGSDGVLAAAQGGVIRLDDGSAIKGGTLATASGGLIDLFRTSTATLDGTGGAVSISAEVAVEDGAQLTLAGSFKNAGAISLNAPNTAGGLVIQGAVTLQGTGNVKLLNTLSHIVSDGSSATLTNRGGTFSGRGTIGDGALTVINASGGVIMANQTNGTLSLALPTVDNTGGVLAAVNGGILQLAAGSVTNGSSGVIAAALQNAHVDLVGTLIDGGTLAAGAGSGFNVLASGSPSALSGVHNPISINAPVSVQSGAALEIGGTLNNVGTLTFHDGATLQVGSIAGPVTATLNGNGSVQLIGSSGSPQITFPFNSTLRNAGNTISVTNAAVGIPGTLVNQQQGTVKVLDGGTLNFTHDSSNAGLMEAAATSPSSVAALQLNFGGSPSAPINFGNTGTMLAFTTSSAPVSTVEIDATSLTNTGAIVSYGAGSTVGISGSIINSLGGAIVTAAGGVIVSSGSASNGIFGDVQNYGSLSVLGPLGIDGSLIGNGSVSIKNFLHVQAHFTGNGSATLDGAGTDVTFEVDGVVASGKITFISRSHTETLQLGNTRQFAGVIDKFSTAAHAQLDLADVKFSDNPQLTWVQVAGGTTPYGYLLVNGGNAGALLMLGSFVQTGFHKAPDAGTGTTITYTPPPSPPAPPSASASSSAAGTEQLVQMMASFGGDSSGMSGNGVTAPASSTTTSDWLALPAAHG